MFDGEDDDGDDDDVSLATYNNSRDVSRAPSPLPSASVSSSSPREDGDVMMNDVTDYRRDHPLKIKLEYEDKHRVYALPLSRSYSDMGSDEDYQQEAVTPSPDPSPSPALIASLSTRQPKRASGLKQSHPRDISLTSATLSYAEMEKATAKFQTGVKVEDALLLLSFHHHVVR